MLGTVQDIQRQLDEEQARSARLEAANKELGEQLRHVEERRLAAARTAEEHRTESQSAKEAAQELQRQLDEEHGRYARLKAANKELGEQLGQVEEGRLAAARSAENYRAAAQTAQKELVKVVAQLADLKRQARTRPAGAVRQDAENATQKPSSTHPKKSRDRQKVQRQVAIRQPRIDQHAGISPLGSLPERITVRPRPAAQVAASGAERAVHPDSSKTAGNPPAPKAGAPTLRLPTSVPRPAPPQSSGEGWLGKAIVFGAGVVAGIATGIESERKAQLDEARTRARRRAFAVLQAIPEKVVAVPDDTRGDQQPLGAQSKPRASLPSAKAEADWSASLSDRNAVKGDANQESVQRGDRPKRTTWSL